MGRFKSYHPDAFSGDIHSVIGLAAPYIQDEFPGLRVDLAEGDLSHPAEKKGHLRVDHLRQDMLVIPFEIDPGFR